MASDNRLIYYTMIHTTRREEILVQSIISLYNSKEGYKWIQDKGDAVVIIIGSEAKSIIDSGQDPFASVKKEHLVCILGNTFYPKDAWAVVHIDLPIKALNLVDKLSDIEKNHISRPFTLGYIPSSKPVKKKINPVSVQESKEAFEPLDKSLLSDGTIDFFAKKSIVESAIIDDKKTIEPSEVILNKGTQIEDIKYKVEQADSVNELDLTANVSFLKSENNISSPVVEKEVHKAEESTLSLELSPKYNFAIGQFTETVKQDFQQNPLVDSEEQVAIKAPDNSVSNAAVSEKRLSETEVIKQPLYKDAANQADVNANDLTEKKSDTLVQELATEQTGDYKVNSDDLSAEQRSVVEEKSNVNEEASILTEVEVEKEIAPTPPLLTEVVVSDSELLKDISSKQQIRHPEAQDSNVSVTETRSENLNTEPAHNKRIKLLRWPKSDVIQQHPGNAILASMVINMPMSANDMAKQSDLSLHVCHNFIEAVVAAKVAEYIGELDGEPSADQEVKKEEVSKRKGILYRIRAALGLLRK